MVLPAAPCCGRWGWCNTILPRDSGEGGPPEGRWKGRGRRRDLDDAGLSADYESGSFHIAAELNLSAFAVLKRQRSGESGAPSTMLRMVPLPRYRGGGYLAGLAAAGTVAVPMLVTMARAAAVGMRAVGRQIDHVAVAHAALGNDVVGELLHVGAEALEHRDFHAAFVVEVHVQRRLRQIVTVVEVAGEALGQIACPWS